VKFDQRIDKNFPQISFVAGRAYHLLKWEEVLYVENVFPKILLAEIGISSHSHIPLWSTPQMLHYVSVE
jgi:hypothetical protein